MKRHRLLGALILSLTATAALAPILSQFGRDRDGGVAGFDPFYTAAGPSPYADTTEHVWSCEQFGGYQGMRGNGREKACGPGKGLHAKARRRPALTYGPVGGGPLDEAVLASIAGDAAGPESLFNVPAPAAALGSQTLATASAKGVGGPIIQSNWGAPQIPGTGALPYNLLAGAGPTLETPPIDPETPVVPLPGALPLMLTGFAALAALRRARRRAASGSSGAACR